MSNVRPHMFGSSEVSLLKKALRLYAGEHVLNRVLALKEHAFEIGGETVSASVLFSDVAAMRPLTEKFDPSTLSSLLNSYLSLLTSCITAHGGVIDALIGDAVSAYWLGDNHAEKACRCARAFLEKLDQHNAGKPAADHPEIVPRVGIHSGHVHLGNYGSADRLRFTVLGDAVNLGSRLCALASGTYTARIIISEPTKVLLSSSFNAVELDSVRVKGLPEPIKLYGLCEV